MLGNSLNFPCFKVMHCQFSPASTFWQETTRVRRGNEKNKCVICATYIDSGDLNEIRLLSLIRMIKCGEKGEEYLNPKTVKALTAGPS